MCSDLPLQFWMLVGKHHETAGWLVKFSHHSLRFQTEAAGLHGASVV